MGITLNKKKGPITADELISRLEVDPLWVKRDRERSEKTRSDVERLRREQEPLLSDLSTLGLQLQSVWDLVNARYDYSAALPILIDHLQKKYSPNIQEGIVRALTVRQAQGIANEIILMKLKSVDCDPLVRWALANALTQVAEKKDIEEIRKLYYDKNYHRERDILKKTLKKLRAI
eukprot:TRINITY_DN112224_c0_g1_i1.p1 TRINITY_DN112224_c0_g1~~TRINITY_DN112224_c0_g1_i1.p1  ORF type:complete len:176 (+),score=0.96 TRINITY_DN112224_c0_g1_i1:82-609(+)